MRIKFIYRNHREKIEERDVTVYGIRWEQGNEDYDYQPGWYLLGYCHDRQAVRSFKFNNIIPKEGQLMLIDIGVSKKLVGELVTKAEALATSVGRDAMGTPQLEYRDSNGGLVSPDTIAAQMSLQAVLDAFGDPKEWQ